MRGVIVLLGLTLSLSLFGCAGDRPRIVAEINETALLSGDLPANPLQWKVVTSTISTADSTMSTLYGNDLAVEYARTDSKHEYPNGAVLALVTWTQREDGRWFGAKFPDRVKSVEFVFEQSGSDRPPSYSYQKYEGRPLKLATAEQSFGANARAAYLLSQRAAVMP
jgi:hypothetical protein